MRGNCGNKIHNIQLQVHCLSFIFLSGTTNGGENYILEPAFVYYQEHNKGCGVISSVFTQLSLNCTKENAISYLPNNNSTCFYTNFCVNRLLSYKQMHKQIKTLRFINVIFQVCKGNITYSVSECFSIFCISIFFEN